jgi:hypothetical protein
MFGYVTPKTEELLVKEHNLYKSIYCGLCKAMGKRVCHESRMTLSYDVVFLVLIRLRLSGEAVSFRAERCAASPFRKKAVMERNHALDYGAAAGALLAYHNLADDAADKRGFRRAIAVTLRGMAKRMRRKADLPALDAVLSERMAELAAWEKSGEATADGVADVFGRLLAEVFGYGLEGTDKRLSEAVGYHVGKWIYLLDAADDYEKDGRRGEFNPLPERDVASLRCALNLELDAASRAMELMPDGDPGIKRILENILYRGMPAKMEKILTRGDGKASVSDDRKEFPA